MYQFYYADTAEEVPYQKCEGNIRDRFKIAAVRPTMWEEHCLECSAPLCFSSCVHFAARSDGRCKRFENGIYVFKEEKGCCGQAAHVKFRKWANMMTIIFPAMLSENEYLRKTEKNQGIGNKLKLIADSPLPQKLRWESIRTIEWLRRRGLRRAATENTTPDAFLFHGFSYTQERFRLIIEIYDEHTSKFKTSLAIEPGENLFVLGKDELTDACWKPNYLVKVYPENDIEAEMDILWCDFAQGEPMVQEQPASIVKCVVWDLDNTLWDGTLIETDNPATLKLKPYVLETIKALDEKGIIQSIASKNEFDAAWAVVEQLGIGEYFLYPQIHWNAKSGSINQIAKLLNIGVDTLALIDDAFFERNQVISVLPQVRVYDPAELDGLLEKPEFQVPVTEESKNRRAMYKAEEKRNQVMQSDNDDTLAFLRKCHLRMNLFEPKSKIELDRCYELIARTNQLNMSGKKYTSEEFRVVLERKNHKNVAFSCQDDFGSYGIVGFAQYTVENGKLVFSEFAMSCRVAGKFVESAFFVHLLEKESCEQGAFRVVKTKKNILLRNTLTDIGFVLRESHSDLNEYVYGINLNNRELVAVYENVKQAEKYDEHKI